MELSERMIDGSKLEHKGVQCLLWQRLPEPELEDVCGGHYLS